MKNFWRDLTKIFARQKFWWAQKGSNLRPSDYESPALTAELWARVFFRAAHGEQGRRRWPRRTMGPEIFQLYPV